ncbi:AcrR family transcriptional regulator [Sphingobium wenxiniae]|uniref:HTH tetR-type domain-containing protein n=2 Tax=Sphingobium TaxID=165695 RepID=T0G4E3_9SPHN|nr:MULTISPECIES: WHG domain-containing protein [Sphingobium]EQA98555.1 hypothetical protein L485_17885 [Sphingobium baderi LL03]KMS61627.1 hypothetical protein V475_12560 [Sphingobium baderi LL03]MBB6193260.1 AcrR family transcriptional regulator [Sphingobium wenxiniae]TWH91423.1 TetR family transcriptional regulator [Sphingobium wenxiniae]WRD75379.1 TetR/AcrR family transcriptional regulator [Sphingobium baderi]
MKTNEPLPPAGEAGSVPASSPDLRAARAAFENDIRATILNEAAAVLRDEGPAAFTIRRIAAAVNASTKAVYTHFGNKDGLFDALYLQSFADLTKAMQEQIDPGEPAASLLRVCHAYRDYACAHPTRYNIMFGDLGRAYEAPLSSRRKAFESFGVLREAVEACLPPERSVEKTRITRLIWATMHGVVSLELRGLLGSSDEIGNVFDDAVTAICLAWSLPLGRS